MPDSEGLSQYFQVENWMYVRPLVNADLNKLLANEQTALSDAIAKYAGLSYDEIKEKSHDVAWRSTARDFAKSGSIIFYVSTHIWRMYEKIMYLCLVVEVESP